MPTTFGHAATTIKVQIPPHTTRVDDVCLVYDKEGKHKIQQPLSQKIKDALKGDTRGFFSGTFDGNFWTIYPRRLPEQFW